MRILSLIIITGILFSSCREKGYDIPPQTWTKDYVYAPGFKIVINQDTVNGKPRTNYGMLKDGDNLVFQFLYGKGGNDNIYDNEYTAKVGFELKPGTTSFSFSNEEMSEAKTHYMGGGAWGGYGNVALTTGFIKGHQTTDSTWQIDIDVLLPEKDPNSGLHHIQESATYLLKYYW